MIRLENGLTVKISHYRLKKPIPSFMRLRDQIMYDATAVTSMYVLRKEGTPINTCLPKGGMTVCDVMDGDKLVARGIAYCRPDENFTRSIGASVARGRAMKQLRDWKPRLAQ